MKKQTQQIQGLQYWITVPLKQTVRSKLNGAEKTEYTTMDLPITTNHIRVLEEEAKALHISHEKALEYGVAGYIEHRREQFLNTLSKDKQQEYIVTMAIHGRIIYHKQIQGTEKSVPWKKAKHK